MSFTSAEKNIIFVTGNTMGEYKDLGKEIALHLHKSVYLGQPSTSPRHYLSLKEMAIQNSLFYSQALFYGSLPSRRSVVFAIPDLTMKNILQFMILLEKVKKNVFVVVDDRFFISQITRQNFQKLLSRLPVDSGFFLTDFINNDRESFFDVIEKLLERITYNSKNTVESTYKCFNGIMESIPELFREEIKKSLFGSEFGDVPFNQLVKNLLPTFNDNEREEEEEKEESYKKSKTSSTCSCSSTIESEVEVEEEEEKKTSSPPKLISQEPEGEFISLFEECTNPKHPFCCAISPINPPTN